jgi:hypothetical protein
VWAAAAEAACAEVARHAETLDAVSRAVALPVRTAAGIAAAASTAAAAGAGPAVASAAAGFVYDASLVGDEAVTFGEVCSAAGLGDLSASAQGVLVDLLAASGRARVTDAGGPLAVGSGDGGSAGSGVRLGGLRWRAVRLLPAAGSAGSAGAGSAGAGDADRHLVGARLAAAALARQVAADEAAWFGPGPVAAGVHGRRRGLMAAALAQRRRGDAVGCARTLERVTRLEAALRSRRGALDTAQRVRMEWRAGTGGRAVGCFTRFSEARFLFSFCFFLA